jgi:hypothetical protein
MKLLSLSVTFSAISVNLKENLFSNIDIAFTTSRLSSSIPWLLYLRTLSLEKDALHCEQYD